MPQPDQTTSPTMPAPKTISQHLGYALASLMGWQVDVEEPIPAKCVIIGAHHTSAFDFVVTIILRMALGIDFNFVAKASLFRGPTGWLARKLGGIPVERNVSQDFVAQLVTIFNDHDTLRIAIMPEGTRGHTTFWRTGFYYMALGANVPIVFGYADYRRKVVGLGPILLPSGDIGHDFEVIRRFYHDVTPRYPGQQGEVQLRPAVSMAD